MDSFNLDFLDDFNFDFDNSFLDTNINQKSSPTVTTNMISSQTQSPNVNSSNEFTGTHFDSNSSRNQISEIISFPYPSKELRNFDHKQGFYDPFSGHTDLYNNQKTNQVDMFSAFNPNFNQFRNNVQFSKDLINPCSSNFSVNNQPCSSAYIQNFSNFNKNKCLFNEQIINVQKSSSQNHFPNSICQNLTLYPLNHAMTYFIPRENMAPNNLTSFCNGRAIEILLEERIPKRMRDYDQVMYTCSKCDAQYPTPQAFGGHMKSHSTNVNKRSKKEKEKEKKLKIRVESSS